MNKKTTNLLSYGLFVLTAARDGKDNGCIINTVCQVASDPLTISIAVNKANYTCDMIAETGKFCVSIISEAAGFDLFTHFGFRSGRDVDKFADFTDFSRNGDGLPYITRGTNGYISAQVTQSLDLGSHTLFIASVTAMEILNDTPSATYAYYHAHIKPQRSAAPAAATAAGSTAAGGGAAAAGDGTVTGGAAADSSTATGGGAAADGGSTAAKQTVWVCEICGYVYEGDELPADYICPICKHPASDFRKEER